MAGGNKATNMVYKRDIISHPCAVIQIFRGSPVSINAAGYLVHSSDVSGECFAGFAEENVDNTGGSVGDLSCKVRRVGIVKPDHDNIVDDITIANVGDFAYAETLHTSSADWQFGLSVTNSVMVGRIVNFISTNKADVIFEGFHGQVDTNT